MIKNNTEDSKAHIQQALINSKGKVEHFDFEILKKLENFSYKGYPINLLLFSNYLMEIEESDPINLGFCLSCAFEKDFKLVLGVIKKLGESDKESKIIDCWIQTEDYIYNPRLRLKFEKEYYYELLVNEILFEMNYEFVKNVAITKINILEVKENHKNLFSKLLIKNCINIIESEFENVNNSSYNDFLNSYLTGYCTKLLRKLDQS